MILAPYAYPIGKFLAMIPEGVKMFSKWQDVKLDIRQKESDHKMEMELMEKQFQYQSQVENIKAQEQIALAQANISEETVKQMGAIALSDNEVKKQIFASMPDWGTAVMTAMRIIFFVAAGIGMFYFGSKCLMLILMEHGSDNPDITKIYIAMAVEFWDALLSSVLAYLGVTHTNVRLNAAKK